MKSVWRKTASSQIRNRGFWQTGWALRVWWKGERGVDYFIGLLRETDKKEFSFRGIDSKIIRRHSR